MTQYRCWISTKVDKSIQLKLGNDCIGDQDNISQYIASFPPARTGNWPALLRKWSVERGINLTLMADGLTISATLKKDKISDFIEYVYGADPRYNDPEKMLIWQGQAYQVDSLNRLKSFVAQDLNPQLYYELMADEY